MDRDGGGVHRLGDLDRSGKWLAAAFAAALLLAPLLAFTRYAPDWMPASDHALMGLRALDVGTSRTPLVGQPSLSHVYVEAHPIRHLGPMHLYLLAPFVRIFGASVGMLLVSVLITGGSVVLAAWATFRQLGPTGGALGAFVLGAITFTTGASSLVMPVSSSIARYPFLCSLVLLWCLICGDVRLLPLAAAVVSFTAQQHLSVLPVLGLATLVMLIGLSVTWFRSGQSRDREARSEMHRWVGGAAAVGVILWAPVVAQQLFGGRPNLSELAKFTTSDDRPTLGYGIASKQLVNVLGLPPLLGQLNLSGLSLFEAPSVVTWLTAALVVAASGSAGVRWRRAHPKRAGLVVMAAVLAVGGLLSSASVPAGWEQYRLVFYHWTFALAYFVLLTLGLAASGLLGRLVSTRRASLQAAMLGVALLGIVVPSVINPRLDRSSNTLLNAWSSIDRQSLDEVADQVMRHRDRLDGSVMVVARGTAVNADLDAALSLALAERGLEMLHPAYDEMWVADERLPQRDTIDAGLVVIVDTNGADGEIVADAASRSPLLGEPIAQEEVPEDFDPGAYDGEGGPAAAKPRRVRVFLLERDQLLDWATPSEIRD